MEDFMTLFKRGVIYDGCPITAKGTIRVQNGELTIDTNHELMAVDGKNFAHLCDPDSKAEHDQLKEPESESKVWEARIAELTCEKEQLVEGMKQTVTDLQYQLRQERELRVSVEDNLAHHNAETESKAKLANTVGELRNELDSISSLLVQKDQKITELQRQLSDKEGRMMEDSKAEILDLKQQISMLQDERSIDQRNANVLVDDFTQWKSSAETKLHALQRELEKNRTTILSLQNELEVAELEDTEHQQTVKLLERENDKLRSELSENIPEVNSQGQTRQQLGKRESIRKYLKSISTNKLKDAAPLEKKAKESKTRSASVAAQFDHRSSVVPQLDKRSSIASQPAM